MVAADEPRRAAGAHQRDQGRYEPSRPEAFAHGVYSSLQPGAGATTRCSSRYDRVGSSQRTQRNLLGAEIRAGCLVCGQQIDAAGSEDTVSDAYKSYFCRRNHAGGKCDGGTIQRIRAVNRLLVIGAGGHGKVVADAALSM